jgi:hypothetical protein
MMYTYSYRTRLTIFTRPPLFHVQQTTARRGRLHPPLHHDAILQFRALDCGAVVVERAVREGRADGVVAGEVLRTRAT